MRSLATVYVRILAAVDMGVSDRVGERFEDNLMKKTHNTHQTGTFGRIAGRLREA